MKNEKFYGTEPKGHCPFEQAAGALGRGRWALGERACGRRWACVGARAGAAGAWAGAAGVRAQGAAAGGALCRLGERQQRAGRAAGWASAAGVRAQRQAERVAGWASGSSAQGARQAGRAATGRAGARAGMAWARRGVRLGARCARGTAGLGVAWALDGWQTGPAGPVLMHCAPGSVLARFLDPVRLGIFPSHQMNTVHYKINFFFKKKYLLNSNKIK